MTSDRRLAAGLLAAGAEQRHHPIEKLTAKRRQPQRQHVRTERLRRERCCAEGPELTLSGPRTIRFCLLDYLSLNGIIWKRTSVGPDFLPGHSPTVLC